MLADFDRSDDIARLPLVVVMLCYLVMSIPLLNHLKREQMDVLEVDRSGGVRVSSWDKQQYEVLVWVVRSLAKEDYIFATPDCPEVYFLTGFKNPTRTTYDFFDDPNGRVDRIVQALARTRVRVVVLNQRPQYSDPPPAELMEHLIREYPSMVPVGNFEVRWKP